MDRQEEDCRALASSLGWTVVAVLVDNDVSAFSGKNRPGYRTVLQTLEERRANAVIAWHTDRLHRSLTELEQYVEVCDRLKVTTQTVRAGELDLATPSGRVVARTLGAMARYESEHKSDRIKRAHLQAAQQGRWRGGTRPFGWSPADTNLRDPIESQMIQDAYADLVRGSSLGEIVRAWNESGMTTTHGNSWQYATVRQVLLRRRNYGASVHLGEAVGEGDWEPITDEATYLTVRAMLTDPRRRKSTSNVGRWLLSGLARCGRCDDGTLVRSATAGRRNGSRFTIYRCSGSVHLARRADYCDQTVEQVVLARLSRDDASHLFKDDRSTAYADLQTEARSIRTRLDALVALFAEGVLSAGQLRSTTSLLRQRLTETEGEIANSSRRRAVDAFLLAGDPQATWDPLSWAQRRMIVSELLTVTLMPVGKSHARVFDPTTVHIDWR